MNKKIRLDNMSAAIETLDRSLADHVYHHLSDRILSGHLVSGDTIDRKLVADELKVSLAPVGEAINRLKNEGFLETSARRHTRVTIVRKEDVRGHLVLRIALERQAVSMVHGQRVRRAKPRLLELAREVDVFARDDPASWPAEIAFRQTLVDLANCPSLSASYGRVMRCNYFFATNSAHIRLPFTNRRTHSDYVEALCTDDAAEADRAMMADFSTHLEVLEEVDKETVAAHRT